MTISQMQIRIPTVKLPNAKEIRLKELVRRKRIEREEKEERLLARWILFCKGRGKSKNLNYKDLAFVRMVEHKGYDRYMSDLILGTKTRTGKHKKLTYTTRTPSRPPSFATWRRIWYAGAKANYRRHDVPAIMNLRMEMLRDANSDTKMRERGGRNLQELKRQIDERERRELDIPMSDVQVLAGGEQGWDSGQEQLRGSASKKAGRNREAEAVGQ